ncbi:MAG: metal-sulfur cluster assembly factor [Candidatus Asgardarchaeia archaeon]
MVTKEEVIKALRSVIDWEIGVDVVSLGLIYDVQIKDENNVKVVMTLTAPGCPLQASIMEQVRAAVKSLGVKNVDVELTFDPPWTPDRMDPEIRKMFGL